MCGWCSDIGSHVWNRRHRFLISFGYIVSVCVWVPEMESVRGKLVRCDRKTKSYLFRTFGKSIGSNTGTWCNQSFIVAHWINEKINNPISIWSDRARYRFAFEINRINCDRPMENGGALLFVMGFPFHLEHQSIHIINRAPWASSSTSLAD